MGCRSKANAMTSGKYLTPADLRKAARKKELQKNKKQRQLLRAAVLKGKDPSQIIEEMEKIDSMEYNNVTQPAPFCEKVLKDKRKKLKNTWNKVIEVYAKDDQEKASELKDQMMKYEWRRSERVSYFEAVRQAQQVQVDEIPLPSSGNDEMFAGALTSQIPLADMSHYTYEQHYVAQRHPLFNIPVPPSTLQETSVHTSTISSVSPTNRQPPGVPSYPPPDIFISDDKDDKRVRKSDMPRPAPMHAYGQHYMAQDHLQMPMPILPPPPPPPQRPPRVANLRYTQKTENLLSSAPQLINFRKDNKESGKSTTTIEAKPQMRNLAGEVTRFLPTSLRVKRLEKSSVRPYRIPESKQHAANTKDDAYQQFMQEMQGLL